MRPKFCQLPVKIGIFLIALILFAVSPRSLSAFSRSSYYDFGSYYSETDILGFSFSSLENLPQLTIPKEVLPKPESGILPGNPLQPFERLWENIQLTVTFDPVKKDEFRLELAKERLSEANTLMDEGKHNLAAEAISNYQEQLIDVSQRLKNYSENKTAGANALMAKAEEMASSFTVLAQAKSLTSAPAIASMWSEVAQTAIKVLDASSDAQGAPPIPDELSTGLQKLKEQGILTPEESDELYSLSSRAEVRKELDKLSQSGQFPVSETNKLNQAIADRYPQAYRQTTNILEFTELRSYETLPPPSDSTKKAIKDWQDGQDVPPPVEIRPYLYYIRAEDLAKSIDLSAFQPEQQLEVAKFYPQAADSNPTLTVDLTQATTSPTPTISTPLSEEASPGASIAQPSGENASPSAQEAPSAAPYLIVASGSLPGEPTYFIKRLGENLALLTTFDSAKRLEMNMRYADERLAEAEAIANDVQKASLYEDALKRYSETISRVSVSVKNYRGEKTDKEELARKLEMETSRHNVVFEKGLLPSSKDRELYTQAIFATEDAMDRAADALDRPALPATLRNRLQDLKAQGLILEEEVADLTKAESREEIRSKVRELSKQGVFPPADAKKLDEAQMLNSPSDFNQLVEVRKVEELQRLRAVQAEFAQTATLRATNATLTQTVQWLVNTIDPSVMTLDDFKGREDLAQAYSAIIATASGRPINSGQFGPEATPGAQLAFSLPRPAEAVLTTCPAGAVFKQLEGCVWEKNGRRINDYDQYRCEHSGQYWSFAVDKCVDYVPGEERIDEQPTCPLPYTWSWQTQSCQTTTRGIFPWPSPQIEPTPESEEELTKRSKQCPANSSYQPAEGCVWKATGKSIYDPSQYKCSRGQYFSFEELKCLSNPEQGEAVKNSQPLCNEPGSIWSWSEGKCVAIPAEPISETGVGILTPPKPVFAAPNSPFYGLKRAVENVRTRLAFSDRARQEVAISQARERLAEAIYERDQKDEEAFRKSLGEYTSILQEVYKDVGQGKNKFNERDEKAIADQLAQIASQKYLLEQSLIISEDTSKSSINSALSVSIQAGDRAADLRGDPAIPEEVKGKIEALPSDMISEEEKKKILDTDNRVEARIKLTALASQGLITPTDAATIEVIKTDAATEIKLNELRKLNDIVKLQEQKIDIETTVAKNEDITEKLDEFQKTFEVGKGIPAEIRPYVRLTRIDEVSQTIRPDLIKLEDFGNRKDIQLAVATLQEEFKPTKEAMGKVEDFRRRNPGQSLPLELARIEALSFSLGVREWAAPCYLPSPPFAANTPCPSPGAAVPVSSYWTSAGGPRTSSPFGAGYAGQDGKPLVYGQGPQPESPGVCSKGYHWMYDNGGWCMSDSGTYGSSYTPYPSTPYSTGPTTSPGYTPYSPYYTAPGAPPATFGYPVQNNYPTPYSQYSPPSYYGPAPSYYTTNPPAGTVPGTGPAPSASGQCPSGFHWMPASYNQAGWCMADGPTYVPSGTATSSTLPPGGYNCGSKAYDPVTKRCADGACPGGYNWDGSKCVQSNYSPGGSYGSCPSGYYWNGSSCQSSGYSPTGPCSPPYAGCGYNSYWDSGSCTCRSGSGPAPSNYCQGLSCGSGTYLDYSTCSCKLSSSTGTSSYSGGSSATGSSCSPPAGGCGSGWFDVSSCSCKAASSEGCYNVAASSCGSGFYWDSAACTCRSSSTSSSGTGATSGSCPSGYHWMSDNGGWCMADGGGSSSTSTTTSPTTTTTTEPQPSSTSTSSPPPSDSGSGSTTTSTETSASPPSSSTETSSPPPSETAPAP